MATDPSSDSRPPRRNTEAISGGLYGLLIGDALGVPYEFNPPDRLPARDCIEFEPPQGFRRSHVGVPPGTWSDDGAHALVLLESLTRIGRLDLADLAEGLRRWLQEGRFAVNRKVFDVGNQTRTAIKRIVHGVAADQSGPATERDNGNGSLMRVLPLALWHDGPDVELAQLAARQSLPTHGHPRAQVCCAMYCLVARALLAGAADPWQVAASTLRMSGLASDEINLVLDPENAGRIHGSGYVLDTLWSARHCLDNEASFEGCVRRAVCLGNDTDTTAAVAGGWAGIRFGLDGIPVRWRTALRGKELVTPLLAALGAQAG